MHREITRISFQRRQHNIRSRISAIEQRLSALGARSADLARHDFTASDGRQCAGSADVDQTNRKQVLASSSGQPAGTSRAQAN
jgi:hypothetical protein